jgi:hypothetical protein
MAISHRWSNVPDPNEVARGLCAVKTYKNIKSGDNSGCNKAELDALEVCSFNDMLCRSLRKQSLRPAATLAQFSVAQAAVPKLARIHLCNKAFLKNYTQIVGG